MEIRFDHKTDEKLRESFCDLAKDVFGLDLLTWYENGFWQDDYIPYSLVEDGKVVSNISVNVCNIRWKSRIRHLAQLGTVMTDSGYRGRGCMNILMKKVLAYCDRSFEGTYLFAQRHMSDFYEKYGFVRRDQYRFSKKVNITNKCTAEKIPMNSKEEWDRMVDIIQRRHQYGERIMVNNPGLFMFYLSTVMSECVYYLSACDTYAVAGTNGDTLTLYAVFPEDSIGLGEVISSFGSGIKNVVLAFTPENNTGFEIKKIEDDETVLFTRGAAFSDIGRDRFMFPEISQA